MDGWVRGREGGREGGRGHCIESTGHSYFVYLGFARDGSGDGQRPKAGYPDVDLFD
jgi:hypothetical protein